MIICILNKDGKPLMPTTHQGKIRRWLKSGIAIIKYHEPFFTIQLLEEQPNQYVQPLAAGFDTGYSFVGYSIINKLTGKELIGGHLKLDCGITERLKEKNRYRRNRRSRMRFRKPGSNNEYATTTKDTLTPAPRHKIDKTEQLINRILEIFPIQEVNIELGKFDMAKMKNPNIKGEEYQQGEQYGFFNVREAVFYRDGHKCQNPNCPDRDKKTGKITKNQILEIHHIIFRGPEHNGSDSPTNLMSLCHKCHTPNNHQPKGFLYKWMMEKKKMGQLKEATFMNIVKSFLHKELGDKLSIPFNVTYGYITKSKRIENKIPKSHHADAFVITGGTNFELMSPDYNFISERRNNRSLETFRDSKWHDKRELPNKVEKSGKELFCGRTKRNKNLAGENLRPYRVPIIDEKTGKRKEITKGKRSIRTKISQFPTGSKIMIAQNWECKYGTLKKGQTFIGSGTQNKGAYIVMGKTNKLKTPENNKKILIPSKICKLIVRRKGIIREAF